MHSLLPVSASAVLHLAVLGKGVFPGVMLRERVVARKKKRKPETDDGRKLICKNRRAHRDYDLEDRVEAGLVLLGTEVKSCRAGNVHLNDAYVQIRDAEAYLVGGHIAEYTHGNRFNHAPDRARKLLLNRHELKRLSVRIRERGLVAIPLSLYFKNGYVKAEIGIGKGRTHEDRRHYVKDREVKRELARIVRTRRR